MTTARTVFSAEQLEWLNSRCDIVAASADARRTPSVCWGMACQVHEDRRSVTLWFRRDQSLEFVDHIRQTGRISVAFEVPLTNACLQIKGRDARVRDAMPSDEPRLRVHLANMIRELAIIGQNEAYCRAAFEQSIDDLVAVEFTVDALYDQTPGPRAGKALRAPS